jgi:hypothetical protein
MSLKTLLAEMVKRYEAKQNTKQTINTKTGTVTS